MKIFYYSPHPQLHLEAPTGYGTHMREMIAAWRRQGHEVKTLIAGGQHTDQPAAAATARHQGIKRYIPSYFWQSVRDLKLLQADRHLRWLLEAELLRFKPDLLYERVAYLQSSGLEAAQATGTYHCAEVNAPYVEERISLSGKSALLGLGRKVEARYLRQADRLIAVSSALKEHLCSHLAGSEAKVSVIANCVNPQQAEVDPKRVEALREKLGLQGSCVIGFVGSIFAYHGVDLLIEAFAGLKSDQDLKLLIVGGGAELSALRALALKLGVLHQCIFTGSISASEVFVHLALMDICCQVRNKWYMSPVKIFEYGLMMKPVIATPVSAVKDVMDADTAMLVDDRVDSYREGLQILIEQPQRRAALAERWHRQVLEHHTWDRAASQVLEACA